MQIEQVIGGVNGDASAQAIQLRMRSNNQGSVQLSRIRVWDATGSNPVLLVDPVTSVPNNAGGSRVLLASASFNDHLGVEVRGKITPQPVEPFNEFPLGSQVKITPTPPKDDVIPATAIKGGRKARRLQ